MKRRNSRSWSSRYFAIDEIHIHHDILELVLFEPIRELWTLILCLSSRIWQNYENFDRSLLVVSFARCLSWTNSNWWLSWVFPCYSMFTCKNMCLYKFVTYNKIGMWWRRVHVIDSGMESTWVYVYECGCGRRTFCGKNTLSKIRDL